MKNKKIAHFTFKNSWLALCVGILITAICAWLGYYNNQYTIKHHLAELADKTENLIEQRFLDYEYGLIGTKAAINTIGVRNITRKQFENYINSRNLAKEFPGSLGFGFIRSVPVNQEAEFLAKARADGASDFNIKTLTPHETDRFIIQYIYPIAGNEQAVGLDIGSEKNRRTAAIASARYDRPFLTAPITLVQANKKKRMGILALLPIYADDAILDSPESRVDAVVGWSYTPLVIADVLADLESLTDGAVVSLTHKSEDEAFFQSRTKPSAPAAEYSFKRDITILGQHWQMAVGISTQSINKLGLYNVGLIAIFGLLLTALGLFTINLLHTQTVNEDELSDISQFNSLKSIASFLSSAQLKRTGQLVMLLLLFIFLISSWMIIKYHTAALKNDLENTKNSAISMLSKVSNQYQQDTLFLANSTSQLINALLVDDSNPTPSKQDLKQISKVKPHIKDMFKAYMLANSNVYQVLFITASNDWNETVKVQRTGEDLKVFTEQELQSKKHEPYINRTQLVGEGNVYQSNINLNRELGKIEQPQRPVWRFSTPLLYDDGRPLGIIIINVNADLILPSLTDDIANHIQLYVTDQDEHFLLHPNTDKAFAHEYGDSESWLSAFPLASHGWQAWLGLVGYQNQQESVLVSEGQFLLDKDGRTLHVYSTSSEWLFLTKMLKDTTKVFMALVCLLLSGMFIQYWLWLKHKIAHRNFIMAQNKALQAKELLRFKGLLEAAPDATLVVNELGMIEMANAAAVYLFGYKPAELEGQPIDKLIPTEHRQQHKGNVASYVQQPQKRIMAEKREIQALSADGRTFPVEISLSSSTLDGKLLVIASLRDVTIRVMEQQKLTKALADAELATQAKSQFLANTSHEIRTPLNAIIGLSYLLADEKLTSQQQQLVSKIQISGKSLLGIINDVLDLAKIEANKMTLEEEPIALHEFLDEIGDIFAIQADAKKLMFKSEFAKDLPLWVNGDSTRLRQILMNLLSNAIKFTNIGSVSLSAQVLHNVPELPDDKKMVRISVRDTGIGISSEAQTRLFKPFSQADESTTRRFGGTGLGLSIVLELVELMQGTVGVDSAKDVGSQFWVDIPLKDVTKKQISNLNNLNQMIFVLIAEDDPTDANLLRNMTNALGWRSEVVTNGVELVDTYIARHNKKLRQPDAIIVDWQMPIMDGLNAIKTLTNQFGRENLPAVLMLSAHDKEVITQHDPENLVNRFLLKPVNSSSLFNAVNDIVSLHTGNNKRVFQSSLMEAVKVKWLNNMRILVVDDRPINLDVITNILKRNGAIVDEALSGEDALILLKDNADDYDAVLMDIQMPGIGGLEAARQARNQLGLTSLPIIALTAGALIKEKNQAFAAGMTEFLTKPINPSQVINVLRMAYESYRGKEAPYTPLDAATETDIDEWPEVAGLNQEQAKQILLNDKALFMKVLNSLLLDFANLMLPPDEDIDNANTDVRKQFASQTHKLKSVSGMIGAQNIQQLATEAESLLHTTDAPVKDTLTALSVELKKLHQASQKILCEWEKTQLDAQQPLGAATTLHNETLTDIVQRLQKQDLSAIDIFDQHSASFRQALGNEQFIQLQANLDNLQFKLAAEILLPLIKSANS